MCALAAIVRSVGRELPPSAWRRGRELPPSASRRGRAGEPIGGRGCSGGCGCVKLRTRKPQPAGWPAHIGTVHMAPPRGAFFCPRFKPRCRSLPFKFSGSGERDLGAIITVIRDGAVAVWRAHARASDSERIDSEAIDSERIHLSPSLLISLHLPPTPSISLSVSLPPRARQWRRAGRPGAEGGGHGARRRKQPPPSPPPPATSA